MNIQQKSTQTLITPSGHLTYRNVQDFTEKIIQYAKSGYQQVCIDFGHVDWIDGVTVHRLCAVFKTLQRTGVRVVLTNSEHPQAFCCDRMLLTLWG